MQEDVEVQSGVREAAKTELRRREWASRRGKATRAFLRENPDIAEEFAESATIALEHFPPHVTKASVLLELRTRAAHKEAAAEVKQWKADNPEEAKRLAEEVRKSYDS